MPTVREEITKLSTNHRAKLLTHPNELTSNLLNEQGPGRLKRPQFPAYNDRLRSWFKLKERSPRDWKVRSTKVDAGDFKHELLNRLRSTMY